MLPMIVNGNGSISTVVGGQTFIVGRDHVNYDLLKKAVIEGDTETFLENVTVAQIINSSGKGRVVVSNGVVKYDGVEIHHVMVGRIISMMDEGFDIEPMLKFLENLFENPSNSSVEQLYSFLDNVGLPITADGCFVGYKYVSVYNSVETKDRLGRILTTGSYVDSYSRTLRNNIGDIVTMPRNKVQDDPHTSCGPGLHVGTFEYSGDHDTVVLVKVNPKDVVSVPLDYSCQKLRCCQYEVIELCHHRLESSLYQYDDDDDDDDVYREDDDDDDDDNYNF